MKSYLKKIFFKVLYHVAPQKNAQLHYKFVKNKQLNLKHPQTLEEKINWMKFNTDTTEWSRLADKYLVREYIKSLGYSDLLVQNYGHWQNANEIDFEKLPQKFVLKTNHGCGTNIFIEDKSQISDIKSIKDKLNKYLSQKYGDITCEPHYLKIKPCIIAEEYLKEENNAISSSLIDYKVWCFSGKPFCIWACHNRTDVSVQVGLYDLDWNYLKDESEFSAHYTDGRGILPRPTTLSQMLEAASKISKDFPQVRVDFYEVNGKLYFGEMTFTACGGYAIPYTQEFLLKMGKQISII